MLFLAFGLFVLLTGLIHSLVDYDSRTICPLVVSVALAAAQLPPHALALYHGVFGAGPLFRLVAWAAMVWCYAALGLALFLVWWLRPDPAIDYDGALSASIRFFAGMKTGILLPDDMKIAPWRSDALLQDGDGVDSDLAKGFFVGGELGLAKATVPMAFSMTMLAWAFLRFKEVGGVGVAGGMGFWVFSHQ